MNDDATRTGPPAAGPRTESADDATQTAPPAGRTRTEVPDDATRSGVNSAGKRRARPDDTTHYRGNAAGSDPGSDKPDENFTLGNELGRGAMGVVYKATQAGFNRPIAVKMLPDGHDDPRLAIRFLAEAEAVAAVDHPHVVKVFEFGSRDGRPYLAMEYLSGGSLAEKLKGGKLPPRDAANLVRKLAAGVEAAHVQGIIHRDLKPGNVLFDSAGEPKVTDFGLARRGGGADLTRTQAVLGTPAYMAPEQARGEAKFVGPAADVWALGVVLYECLTGRRPFAADDAWGILQAVMNTDPSGVRDHVPEVPLDLSLIVHKCLQKNAAERYPTAAELGDDLRRYLGGEAISVRPLGRSERAARWVRRNPTRAAVVGLTGVAVVLTAATAGAGWLWHRAEDLRGQAETSREAAVTARHDAETALGDAVGARAREAEARAAADRAEAEVKRDRERQERFREMALYGRTLDLVYRELRDGNYPLVRSRLEAIKPALRGWEWDYLQRLSNPDLETLKGHTGSVYAARFSPAGDRVATAGSDGTVRLWHARTATEVKAYKDPKVFQWIVSTAFDAAGARLAFGSNSGALVIWDPVRDTVKKFKHGDNRWVFAVGFTPAGDRLVSVGSNGVKVSLTDTGIPVLPMAGPVTPSPSNYPEFRWDRPFRQFIESDVARPEGTEAISAAALDASAGRAALAIGATDRIVLWDVVGAKAVKEFKAPFGRVYAVALSPDGRRLAAGGDQAVTVWEAETGKVLHSSIAHLSKIGGIAFSPDGARFVTCSWDSSATLRDVATGQALFDLPGHGAAVQGAGFSPDGRTVVTAGGDGTARLWTTDTGAGPRIVEAQQIALSGNGKRFATTTLAWLKEAGSEIRTGLYETRTGEKIADVPTPGGPKGNVYPGYLTLNADGTRLRYNGGGNVYDAAVGAAPGRTWHGVSQVDRSATAAAAGAAAMLQLYTPQMTGFVPGGDQFILHTWNAPTLAVHDTRTGKLVRTLTVPGIGQASSGIVFSTDGLRFCCSPNFTGVAARVYDFITGAMLLEVPTGQYDSYRGLAARTLNADGSLLAVTLDDNSVQIWNVAAKTIGPKLIGHTKAVSGVAFSPDGTRVATSSHDGIIRIWHTETGAELLGIPNNASDRVQFSPDGKCLIVFAGGKVTFHDSEPPRFAPAARPVK